MRPEILIPLCVSAATLLFSAGGIYFAFRQLRRDVNGVGRKLNTLEEKQRTEARKILTVFLLFCTDQQREKIASLLND